MDESQKKKLVAVGGLSILVAGLAYFAYTKTQKKRGDKAKNEAAQNQKNADEKEDQWETEEEEELPAHKPLRRVISRQPTGYVKRRAVPESDDEDEDE